MKIVEFIPQLSSGGAERFVVDLANELSKQHTVYLLVSYPLDYNHNFYSSELSSRIKIYSLNDVNDDKLNQFNDYICDRIR